MFEKFDYLEHPFTIQLRLYGIEDMQCANQVNGLSVIKYWKTIYRLYLSL